MYSMVLMAALTTGVAAPDCHRCGGCCGCYGGWGGCYGGCWGGCYGGCWGGCYGGCGGCYGCWGGYSSWGCMGCMGCYGGYGLGGYGGYNLGGYGVGGYGVGGYGVTGGGMAPGTGTGTGTGTGAEELKNKPNPNKNGNDKDTLLPTRAKLIVELPNNAKLFIDDMPMKTTSGVRTFNTPALEPGQAYYYMVRVEFVLDGKTVSQERRVIVRAGQIARAEFTERDTDVRTVKAK